MCIYEQDGFRLYIIGQNSDRLSVTISYKIPISSISFIFAVVFTFHALSKMAKYIAIFFALLFLFSFSSALQLAIGQWFDNTSCTSDLPGNFAVVQDGACNVSPQTNFKLVHNPNSNKVMN